MPVPRVLIVRLGAFGDIVHTLPLAADLHAAGWRVDWLCEDRWAELIRGSPAIDRVRALPAAAWRRGVPWAAKLNALQRMLRELRQANYTAVIEAQGLGKSAGYAAACGAPLRIAHRRPRARELNLLLPARRSPVDAIHVIDQQRALGVALLGRAHRGGGWRFPLPSWPAAESWLAALLDAPRPEDWALNVGAGWPTKVWPEARLLAFTQAAVAGGRRIWVLWGSPGERAVAERVVAGAAGARLAPPTSLPQLGAFLRRLGRHGLLVSGDTGPLHLALATGCAAVGLFGPVPAERNGPRGPGYRNVQAPGKAWERRDASLVDMGAITPEQVLAAAATALAERS